MGVNTGTNCCTPGYLNPRLFLCGATGASDRRVRPGHTIWGLNHDADTHIASFSPTVATPTQGPTFANPIQLTGSATYVDSNINGGTTPYSPPDSLEYNIDINPGEVEMGPPVVDWSTADPLWLDRFTGASQQADVNASFLLPMNLNPSRIEIEWGGVSVTNGSLEIAFPGVKAFQLSSSDDIPDQVANTRFVCERQGDHTSSSYKITYTDPDSGNPVEVTQDLAFCVMPMGIKIIGGWAHHDGDTVDVPDPSTGTLTITGDSADRVWINPNFTVTPGDPIGSITGTIELGPRAPDIGGGTYFTAWLVDGRNWEASFVGASYPTGHIFTLAANNIDLSVTQEFRLSATGYQPTPDLTRSYDLSVLWTPGVITEPVPADDHDLIATWGAIKAKIGTGAESAVESGFSGWTIDGGSTFVASGGGYTFDNTAQGTPAVTVIDPRGIRKTISLTEDTLYRCWVVGEVLFDIDGHRRNNITPGLGTGNLAEGVLFRAGPDPTEFRILGRSNGSGTVTGFGLVEVVE